MERRTAVIILSAPKGDVRAAKGLVGRAIRDALPKARKWHTLPHSVTYISARELRDYGVVSNDPRFTLQVTDGEMACVSDTLSEMAEREGWSRGAPVDIYHD